MARSVRGIAWLGALVVALMTAPAHADGEHALINARISEGRTFVSSPHMLVRVGQAGRITLGGGPNRPKFGLKVKVLRQADGQLDADISALINGAEVAHASTQFTDQKPSDLQLEGGGYTFDVHAALFSDALRHAGGR